MKVNTIYRVIWSASLKTWVVASELSSGRRKRKTRTLLLSSALLSCTAVAAAAAPDAELSQQHLVAPACVAAAGDIVDEQHCDVAEDATPRSVRAEDPAEYMVVNSTGAAATAGGLDAIAVGTSANAEARNTIALGSNAAATAVGGIAIGHDASVERDPDGTAGSGGMHGIAIGEGAKVGMNMDDPDWHYMKADKAMALGAYSAASGERSVALGAESVADEDMTVSVGSNSLKRRITNVAAGTQSHHAATFGQLQGAAQALGGGAGFSNDTGAFKGPTYVFSNGNTFDNVGDALAELDDRVVTIEDGGARESLIGQDPNSGVIGVGATVGGDEVNFAGTDGDRRLSGVAAGTQDNDAVNVAQLNTVNDAVQTNAADIVQNTSDIAANTTSITALDTRVGANAADIVQNTSDIQANTTSITALDTRVGTNAADIVQNTSDIEANTTSITALDTRVGDNATAIGGLDTRVTALESGAGGDDLVGQDGEGGVIGVGAAVGGDEVNFAGTDGDRRLSGVAAGTQDNDAVNVAQLNTVNDAVQTNAADIVQNTSDIAANTSSITALDTRVGDNATDIAQNATDIASHRDLISGLDTRVNDNSRRIGLLESGAGGDDLVGQDPSTLAIQVGTGVGGTEVSFAGTEGDRRLSGVAAGEDDNDAVNVAQLKAVGLVDENGNAMEAVTYDSDTRADGTRSVSFAGPNGTVLNNVADGMIGAGSRQAVNGGQLAQIRDALQGQVDSLEGRVSELESNPGNPGPGPDPDPNPDPNPGHGGEGEGSVAIGEGASASGKGSTAIGNGASASADGSVALGEGSVADREGTVSVGSAGNERQITNVAAGTADTDAVNVAQMKEADAQTLSAAKDYTDQRIDDIWSDLGGRIDDVERNANKGIAASAALIMTTPYVPGRVTLNAGMASYKGEAALGIGISRWSENGRINFNTGVSAARGDAPLFRVGVGIIFGD